MKLKETPKKIIEALQEKGLTPEDAYWRAFERLEEAPNGEIYPVVEIEALGQKGEIILQATYYGDNKKIFIK